MPRPKFAFWKPLTLALLLTLSTTVSAAETNAASDPGLSNRHGVYLSLLGDSVLPFFSINGAYELTPDWRLTAGLGISIGYTIGVGAKYLFFRGNSLRPFLGFNASLLYTDFASGLSGAISEIFGNGPKKSYYEFFGYLGGSFGLDWKHSSGFNLGLGGNVWTNFILGFNATFVPFINLGWYF